MAYEALQRYEHDEALAKRKAELRRDAGERIDTLVKARMARTGEKSYEAALKAELRELKTTAPTLYATYAAVADER